MSDHVTKRGRNAPARSPIDTPSRRRATATRRALLDAALRVAEAEGWNAVTTRRVAAEIEYTQPVVYQHFASRADLVDAVVLEGFSALTAHVEVLTDDIGPATTPHERLAHLARAYVEFARAHPRRYEAMFSQPTTLEFASAATPPELCGAFDALCSFVAAAMPDDDPEPVAECFWACCHGLASLVIAGRIPEASVDAHVRRIAALAT